MKIVLSPTELALQKAETEYVALVKKWVREQLPLWQQIPYLALKASARSGMSYSIDSACETAYESGIWKLNLGNLEIDCATGTFILNRTLAQEFEESELTYEIMRIDRDNLDAKEIISYLKGCERHKPDKDLLRQLDYRTIGEFQRKKCEYYGLHPDKYIRKEPTPVTA